jgi:threonine/homoserine/homoserine lactone efflux protein
MFWLLPLIKGIGQGILISLLSFGPSFFTLINSGMQGGRKAGLRVALGIFLSESFIAMLCYFGLSRVFTYPEFQITFSFVAAAIIFIGIKGFAKNYENFIKSIEIPIKSSQSFVKGFILNLMNPFALFLWVTLLAAISVSYDKTDEEYTLQILANLGGILLTLLAMDVGKVMLSDFLGRKLSNKVYFYVHKYFGLILLLIGVYFFYHFVVLLAKYFHFAGY